MSEPSPALILRFPAAFSAASRDRLVATLAEQDLLAIQEDDLSAPRVWITHFTTAAARDRAAASLQADAAAEGFTLEPLEVDDGDWARRTQADLPAVRVGRVVVAPPWDLPAPAAAAASDIVVEIEPSRGFGTGHHQSTRLCLTLLQAREVAGRTAIDAGTGSGVLAIVAARLGAPFVSAFDSDPEAIENARENIERNGVTAAVEAHVRDLEAAGLAPADLVTANLTGALLARYAAQLAALVRPGGSLIAAGFTVDEKPGVLEAFAPAFGVTESAEEDDWWGVVLTRL